MRCNYHKEEATAHIASDKKDIEILQSKIETCIHFLKPESHPEQLVNVANRTIGMSQINVDQAISIGHSQGRSSGMAAMVLAIPVLKDYLVRVVNNAMCR